MKRLLILAFCAALVLALGTVSLKAQRQGPIVSEPPQPPTPPAPRVIPRVLFLSNQGSTHFRLYSMKLDGTDVQQIPNWTDDDNWPSYSPDGRTIVFASFRTGSWHIFAMNSDGSGVSQLTNSPNMEMEPAYSPAGGVVAFTCKGPNWQDICLSSANGGNMSSANGDNIVKLTDGLAFYSSPVFSPDGGTIAFVGVPKPHAPCSAGTAPGLAPQPPPGPKPDIYILRLSYPLRPVKITDGSTARYAPVFTPDGRHIIYDQDAYGEDGTDPGLFVMGLDGSNQRPLTYYSGTPNDQPGTVGTKVVFTTPTFNGGVDIFSMSPDGSQVQRLTTNGATNLRYLNMFDY